MIHLSQFLHILVVDLPMEPETNAIVSFFLDLAKFDVFPTDLLFDSFVFGELEETSA